MGKKSKHLLVDGYNTLYALHLMDLGLERARDELVKIAQYAHDVEGLRTSLVFDGKGRKINIEFPLQCKTFAVIYGPSNLSADSVIEQMVINGKKKCEYQVVTEDHALRDVCMSAGAVVMNTFHFVDWMDRCKSQQDRYLTD